MPVSAVAQPPHDVVVVTTAALPWRTGPAYLSLWQACGLAALGYRVAYGLPWIPPRAQRRVWGAPLMATPADQVAWLTAEARRLGCPPLPPCVFYPGHGSGLLRSIVPLRDVFAAMPPSRVVVLAEPEHLCWFPFTRPRRRVAAAVVLGLVMTDYDAYLRAGAGAGGRLLARLVAAHHRRLIRRHTDWVVPLSPAVAALAGDHPTRAGRITGVLSPYARVAPVTAATGGVYFLGRLVWDKGLDEVITVARRLDRAIDVWGDGPDGAAIRARAAAVGAPVRFLGPCPAPWEVLPAYRVFFNPSRSEVLCTATADALVAGRHVVLPAVPGNEPFRIYPNTHFYEDTRGAMAALERARKTPPSPATAARRDFDWPGACARLAALWQDAAPD